MYLDEESLSLGRAKNKASEVLSKLLRKNTSTKMIYEDIILVKPLNIC